MINEENTDIFICNFKSDFKNPLNLTNKVYKVLTTVDLDTDSGLEVIKFTPERENILWCEWSHFDYILKNIDSFKDNIGICSYRRYFDFKDDVSILNNYNYVLVKPDITINNVLNYGFSHSFEDFGEFYYYYIHLFNDKEKLLDVIENFVNSNMMFSNNMVILPKNIFKDLVKTTFTIMDAYLSARKIKTYEDVKNHILDPHYKFIKTFSPNDTLEYQMRYIAYYCERIFSMFLMDLENSLEHNEVYYSEKIISEKKYNDDM